MSLESKNSQHTNAPARSVAGHSNTGGIARPAVDPLQKMSSDSLSDVEPLLQPAVVDKGYHAAIPPLGSPSKAGNGLQLMRKAAPVSRPAGQVSPVQRMEKKQYDTLSNLFKPQVKWTEFHKKQKEFQADDAYVKRKPEHSYDYTTFGTEYEMIPYKASNAIANTAHIKLAEGVGMPVKAGVKEALVTDSDNVIEYVSPVFILPLVKGDKNITAPAVDGISQVKRKLADFKKEVYKGGFTNFKALLDSAPMGFTNWAIKQELDISFREIDENTNVPGLKNFGNTLADIQGIQLGFDPLAKNPKHKELKNGDEPGSAMQTTVLLPLDVVAKIIRGTMDGIRDKEQPAAASSAPGKKPAAPKAPAPGTGIKGAAGDLIRGLTTKLHNVADKENVIDLIYLFGQRLSLVLEAPNAVKFQAHYQATRFGDPIPRRPPVVAPVPGVAPVVAPVPGVAPVVAPDPGVAPVVAPDPGVAPVVAPVPGVAPVVAPDPGVAPVVAPVPGVAPVAAPVPAAVPNEGIITAPGLLAQYAEEEEVYNEKKAAGKLSEIPNNFHSAHSSIKDRLSIWTRIHLDDLIVAIGKNLDRDNKVIFLSVVNEIAQDFEEVGTEIYGKIKQVVNGVQEYKAHETVHFLDENEQYIDLRQDTLRDIQVIDGRPWVLIEIRDLKETTLNALKAQGTPR